MFKLGCETFASLRPLFVSRSVCTRAGLLHAANSRNLGGRYILKFSKFAIYFLKISHNVLITLNLKSTHGDTCASV